MRAATRLPPPVELSVVLRATAGSAGARVVVSPSRVGAGQLLLDIANEFPRKLSLALTRMDGAAGRGAGAAAAGHGSYVVARSGAIAALSDSQLKAQVSRGVYRLSAGAGPNGTGSGPRGTASGPGPRGAGVAILRVGPQRPGGNGALLAP